MLRQRNLVFRGYLKYNKQRRYDKIATKKLVEKSINIPSVSINTFTKFLKAVRQHAVNCNKKVKKDKQTTKISIYYINKVVYNGLAS